MSQNKPDYRLAAKDKRTEATANVGAAWINKDGSIGIKVNAFTVLPPVEDLLLTLFPVEES